MRTFRTLLLGAAMAMALTTARAADTPLTVIVFPGVQNLPMFAAQAKGFFAKRDLKKGEMLDGEGGFCVWGKQTPADVSLAKGLLPLGLAHNVKLKGDIPQGGALKWSDVAYDPNDSAVKVRREMEAAFGRRNV